MQGSDKVEVEQIHDFLQEQIYQKLSSNHDELANLQQIQSEMRSEKILPKEHQVNSHRTTNEQQWKVKNFRELRNYSDLEKYSGNVVEFECQIQDFLNSEIYASLVYDEKLTREAVKEGSFEKFKQALHILKYRDDLSALESKIDDNFETQYDDRLVYYAIPTLNNTLATPRTDDDSIEEKIIEIDLNESLKLSNKLDLDQIYEKLYKKTKSFNFHAHRNASIQQFPCILNFYNENDNLSINDLVRGRGILYYTPQVHEYNEDIQHFSQLYPNHLVPRIHVTSYQVLKSFEQFKKIVKGEQPQVDAKPLQTLLKLLEEIFEGDKLVSQYFVFSLVTSIVQEIDALQFGKLCLNIILGQGKAQIGGRLNHLLRLILDESIYLSLQLDVLDRIHLSPNKNNETDQLETGLLQVSPILKPFLLIDEVQMQEGKLENIGIKNILILKHLLQNQKLQLTSPYFNTEFATDFSIVILSESQSFLPFDLKIKIREKKSNQSELDSLLLKNSSEESLKIFQDIKAYLMHVKSQLLTYNLDNECSEKITEHFVKTRDVQSKLNQEMQNLLQSKGELVDTLILNRWILLTKIQGALSLHPKAQTQDFQEILELESQRILSLEKM